MFIRSILSATLLAASATGALAGGFVDVLANGARTPGSTNNPATDPFYIVSIPTTWTQLAQRTTAVDFDIYDRDHLVILGNYVAGTFIDTVWRESGTQALIFGSYFRLTDTTRGITEISSLVRSGFGGIGSVSAAWTFADTVYSGAAGGYRLRDPSRSDYVATYVATDAANGSYYSPTKVAMRTDISPSEGNPNSGLYFLKVAGANYSYTVGSNTMRIVQGASATEGGRIFQDTMIDAFVAIPLAVPELESYALMLAGLGVLGVVVRRRRRQLD